MDSDASAELPTLFLTMRFMQTGHGQCRVKYMLEASVPLWEGERLLLHAALRDALGNENALHQGAAPWVHLTEWDTAFMEVDVAHGTRFASLTARNIVSYPHGTTDLRERIEKYCANLAWHVVVQ